MIGCNVISNRADNHSGGLSGVNGMKCNIIGNIGGGAGGGGGPSTLDRCVIRQNTIFAISGGIANNCLMAENTSPAWSYTVTRASGALANPVLINCTVVSNSNAGDKPAIQGGSLTNCIVYYNTPADFTSITTAAVEYCCTSSTNVFTNLVSGLHNITNAPLFAGASNYHLAGGSPGIDAGMDLPGVITNDLDGLPRPKKGGAGRGAKWDMGCYEFLPKGTFFSGH